MSKLVEAQAAMPGSSSSSSSSSSSETDQIENNSGEIVKKDVQEAADMKNELPWRQRLREHNTLLLLRRVGAEFIGSFFLMFFICGLTMGVQITHDTIDYLYAGIVAAFGIIVVIFSFGHISGAHVNPAVTIGFASVGKFPWLDVPWYILGQFAGGILGCGIGTSLYGVSLKVALVIPNAGIPRAFFMEYLVAMIFMILASSVASNAHVLTGLHASVGVGASIALSIVLAGPVSGSSMNPVRAFAPAVFLGYWKDVWIYLIATPLGTLSGAWLYKILST